MPNAIIFKVINGWHPSCAYIPMLKNYWKIAVRVLLKNKAYSIINVIGLALSMTCGILIFTLVKYHLSFDNFHKDADRIYRFVTEQHRDRIDYAGSVPPPFGKAFRDDYSFGEQTARFFRQGDCMIALHTPTEVKKFKEKEGADFVEPSYFDIFNFPLLRGDKHSMLTEPNTAVVTERIAHKYFGNEDPIGKTFWFDNRLECRITGVLKDLPANTDLQANIFISWPTMRGVNSWVLENDAWGGITSELQCYTRLRPGVNPAEVEKLLTGYVKKYRPKSKNVHFYKLQPMSEVHFDARFGGIMAKRNLWIISIIGALLIVTACVNFINLATAQALRRSKEVGIRRVLGGMKAQLFWQFIAETGLITVLATVLALVLSMLILPVFNDWFHARMTIDLSRDGLLLGFIPLLMLLVTFLAGAYPGLILAGFRPVLALKGRMSIQHVGNFNIRRTLIVTQFTISFILIMGMLVITRQMQYTRDADLGFDKDAIVMLPIGADSVGLSTTTTAQRLASIPGVENVSVCFDAPSSENNWGTTINYDTRSEPEVFRVSIKAADAQYLSTFGLHLVAGRNIFAGDSVKECVVNETMIKKLQLGSPEEALGKNINFNREVNVTITGVVRDFRDRSLHEDITAVCITPYKREFQAYAVKLNMKNIRKVMPALEKTWNSAFPDKLYEYQFLDDSIAGFYELESTVLKLVRVFSFIAIFIGCLGLYGLVAFMVAHRTKEIGIRKVLGSTVGDILWIFGKEFSRLIVIAFLIAAPVTWLLMDQWLRNFKNHIPLGPWLFVLGLLIIVLIAACTIGFQSVRAALANPVKSLRTE
ncbi:MAG TPA: ABC transporter permease [Puia sp.]|jgi:ABC-type antimicrobial peptide transport system permease subunit